MKLRNLTATQIRDVSIRRLRLRRGFTLIELLVVIAIIAILASILFPVFSNARERGRMTACLSNMKNLALAFRQYMDDNQGRMPSINWTTEIRVPDWAGTKVFEQALLERGSLWPYVKSDKIYVCPTDKKVSAVKIPANTRNYRLSYAVNERLHFAKLDSQLASNSASRCLLMIHESRKTINDGYFNWTYTGSSSADAWSDVHYDGTTVSYCDGHAKRLSVKQLEKERFTQDTTTGTARYIWDVF